MAKESKQSHLLLYFHEELSEDPTCLAWLEHSPTNCVELALSELRLVFTQPENFAITAIIAGHTMPGRRLRVPIKAASKIEKNLGWMMEEELAIGLDGVHLSHCRHNDDEIGEAVILVLSSERQYLKDWLDTLARHKLQPHRLVPIHALLPESSTGVGLHLDDLIVYSDHNSCGIFPTDSPPGQEFLDSGVCDMLVDIDEPLLGHATPVNRAAVASLIEPGEGDDDEAAAEAAPDDEIAAEPGDADAISADGSQASEENDSVGDLDKDAVSSDAAGAAEGGEGTDASASESESAEGGVSAEAAEGASVGIDEASAGESESSIGDGAAEAADRTAEGTSASEDVSAEGDSADGATAGAGAGAAEAAGEAGAGQAADPGAGAGETAAEGDGAGGGSADGATAGAGAGAATGGGSAGAAGEAGAGQAADPGAGAGETAAEGDGAGGGSADGATAGAGAGAAEAVGEAGAGQAADPGAGAGETAAEGDGAGGGSADGATAGAGAGAAEAAGEAGAGQAADPGAGAGETAAEGDGAGEAIDTASAAEAADEASASADGEAEGEAGEAGAQTDGDGASFDASGLVADDIDVDMERRLPLCRWVEANLGNNSSINMLTGDFTPESQLLSWQKLAQYAVWSATLSGIALGAYLLVFGSLFYLKANDLESRVNQRFTQLFPDIGIRDIKRQTAGLLKSIKRGGGGSRGVSFAGAIGSIEQGLEEAGVNYEVFRIRFDQADNKLLLSLYTDSIVSANVINSSLNARGFETKLLSADSTSTQIAAIYSINSAMRAPI